MARHSTKSRRKRHQPRPIDAHALFRTLGRVHKFPADAVAAEVSLSAAALRAFSAGEDCARHWLKLVDHSNVAETMSAMGLCSGPDADRVIEQAQAALAAVQVRHCERRTWTLYPAELEALTWLLSLHARQLSECDQAEFDRAWSTTHARLSQARAGNAPPGAIVIHGDIA